MIGKIITLTKLTGLIGATAAGLIILGNTLDRYINWDWLTHLFKIIRNAVELTDFIIDTDTLFLLIGYSFLIQVAVWGFKLTLYLVDYFRKNSD